MNKLILNLENKYLNYIQVQDKLTQLKYENNKDNLKKYLRKKKIFTRNEYLKEFNNYKGWIKLNNFML